MSRLPDTIETVTGLAFNYRSPMIRREDVAHGLSHVCRFGGHTETFYSVCEHSLLVACIVAETSPQLARAALWHDAHEAYIGDLPTPLKEIVGEEYKLIAASIDDAVADYLEIDVSELHHPLVKMADEIAVAYEASLFKRGPGWEFTRGMQHRVAEEATGWELGLTPRAARNAFLRLDEEVSRAA